MKLHYQTAIATMIQFIVLSLLGVANGLNSVVSTCHSDGTDCVSNLIVSLIFFLITAVWFAFVWLVGYTAQERRSRHMAQLLIAVELIIALVAAFNAKHHTDFLSLFTSLVDFGFCIWVIRLAWRLMQSGGGRVVNRRRSPRKSAS